MQSSWKRDGKMRATVEEGEKWLTVQSTYSRAGGGWCWQAPCLPCPAPFLSASLPEQLFSLLLGWERRYCSVLNRGVRQRAAGLLLSLLERSGRLCSHSTHLRAQERPAQPSPSWSSYSPTQNCQSGLEENFVSTSRPRAGQLHFTGLRAHRTYFFVNKDSTGNPTTAKLLPAPRLKSKGWAWSRARALLVVANASSSCCRKVGWPRCVLRVSKVVRMSPSCQLQRNEDLFMAFTIKGTKSVQWSVCVNVPEAQYSWAGPGGGMRSCLSCTLPFIAVSHIHVLNWPEPHQNTRSKLSAGHACQKRELLRSRHVRTKKAPTAPQVRWCRGRKSQMALKNKQGKCCFSDDRLPLFSPGNSPQLWLFSKEKPRVLHPGRNSSRTHWGHPAGSSSLEMDMGSWWPPTGTWLSNMPLLLTSGILAWVRHSTASRVREVVLPLLLSTCEVSLECLIQC